MRTARDRLAVAATASLIALGAIAPPASASHGTHEDSGAHVKCEPGFTSDRRWQDRSGADGALLIAEIASDIAEDIDEPISKAITGGIVQVLRVIAFGIETRNEVMLACVFGNHWNDEDTLLQLTLQAGLAVTTPPDGAALVPGPKSAPAPGTNPFGEPPADSADDPVGMLDRPTEEDVVPQGVKQVVAQVLDDMEATTGCACAQARAYQAEADRQYAAGAWKAAYANYRRAYVAAMNAADGPTTGT